MAWDDNQPPWGQKQPPTLEAAIAALLKKLKEKFGGAEASPDGTGSGGLPPGYKPPGAKSSSSGRQFEPSKALVVAGIIAAGLFAYASFFTIAPGQKGLVLRFGKFNRIASSGLNFRVPLMEALIKVDVETVRKEEFGFRTVSPGQKSVFEKKGHEAESLMLTGDKNVIDVEWIVQYKVRDPFDFVFKVRDVPQSVRDVSEMVIRRMVGNQDFDYVLTNREILESGTAKELQEALDRYESGVQILTVKLQDVNPPNAVKQAFNEVNEADQDMKRLVNEAEENYNQVIPKARGDAKKMLEEAHGYAVERVNLAQGDASRFLSIHKEYKGAREVTRQRMYLEAMQQVLPTVKEVYVLDKDQKTLLPFLDLGGAGARKLEKQ